MTQRIEIPDGVFLDFPDDMGDPEIRQAILTEYPDLAQTASPSNVSSGKITTGTELATRQMPIGPQVVDPALEIKPSLADYAGQAWEGAKLIPGSARMAMTGALQGRKGAVTYDPQDAASLEQIAAEERFARANKEILGEGFIPEVVGGIPNVGYSLASIPSSWAGMKVGGAAGAAVGSAVPLIGTGIGAGVGGVVGGIAAGLPAMARADQYRNALQLLSKENERLAADGLDKMDDAKALEYINNYKSQLIESGLWEAVPEAISTVIDLTILRRLPIPVGKKMLTKGFSNLAKGAAGILASEWPMETVTQIGQSQALAGTPISQGEPLSFTSPEDIATAARQTLPSVIGVAGAMGGVNAVTGTARGAVQNMQDQITRREFEAARAGEQPTGGTERGPTITDEAVPQTYQDGDKAGTVEFKRGELLDVLRGTAQTGVSEQQPDGYGIVTGKPDEVEPDRAVVTGAESALTDPASTITAAANEAATSPLNDIQQPTDAQKKAGNYKKGHIAFAGLDITIENPAGSRRTGIDSDGEAWSVDMPAHYGYVKSSVGADGDQVDIYMGDSPTSENVFIVNQVDATTGKFDEHKVMLGFDNYEDAVATYVQGFSDGRGQQRIGGITATDVESFKGWLKTGKTTLPTEQITPVKKTPTEYTAIPDEVGPEYVSKAATKTPAFKAWFGESKIKDYHGRPKILFHATTADFEAFRRRPGDVGIHFGTKGQAEDRIDYLVSRGAKTREGENLMPVYLSIKNPLRLRDAGTWTPENIVDQLQELFPSDRISTKPKWYDGTQWVKTEHVLRTNKDIREYLQSKGYDGIVYRNDGEIAGTGPFREKAEAAFKKLQESLADYESQEQRDYEEAVSELFKHKMSHMEDSYIAFERTQIKSAIGNIGKFSKSKPSIIAEPDNIVGDINVIPDTQGRDTQLRETENRDVLAPGKLSVIPSGTKGAYYVTATLTEVNKRKLPKAVSTVTEAAQAFTYMQRYAVEHYDALVTDAKGKPLAMVGSFKGALASASVYPEVLAFEVSQIPNAAYVWASHNHPSGDARFSNADKNLNEIVSDLLRGSGVDYRGLFVITRKNNTFPYNFLTGVDGSEISGVVERETAQKGDLRTVSVMERMAEGDPDTVKLNDPVTAGPIVAGIARGQAGIVVAATNMTPVAFIPIDPKMVGNLREKGKLISLLNALSKTTPSRAFLASPFHYDSHGNPVGGFDRTELTNLVAALNSFGVTPTDAFSYYFTEGSGVSTQSISSSAQRGEFYIPSTFFSKRSAKDTAEYGVQRTHHSTLEGVLAEVSREHPSWRKYIDMLIARGKRGERGGLVIGKAFENSDRFNELLAGKGVKQYSRMPLGSEIAPYADLHGVDLSNGQLAGKNLHGVNLINANLRGADLRGTDLTDSNLSGANLRGADLSGAVVYGAIFNGADVRGTRFDRAIMSPLERREFRGVLKQTAQVQEAAKAWYSVPQLEYAGKTYSVTTPEGRALALVLANGKEFAIEVATRGIEGAKTTPLYAGHATAYWEAMLKMAKSADGKITRGEPKPTTNIQFSQKLVGDGKSARSSFLREQTAITAGFYSPDLGIAFINTDALTSKEAVAVIIHEMTHAADSDAKMSALGEEVLKRLEKYAGVPIYKRVASRMEEVGAKGSSSEALNYLLEESLQEAHRNGFSRLDGGFWRWAKRNLHFTISKTIKQWVAIVRGAMYNHGILLDAEDLSIDDMLAVAVSNIKDIATGRREAAGVRKVRATLNIGMDVNDGGKLTETEVRKAIDATGAVVLSETTRLSDSEPTRVIELDRPLTKNQAFKVSKTLRQDAIAQYSEGEGFLAGPEAAKWGDFNPEFFLLPNGKRVSSFKDWFGDSKVVDHDGDPMVVYHGTRSDFVNFSLRKDTRAAIIKIMDKLFDMGLISKKLIRDKGLTGSLFEQDLSKVEDFVGGRLPRFDQLDSGTAYFTNNITLAESYATNSKSGDAGANIRPVYLSLQKPVILNYATKGVTLPNGKVINGLLDGISDYWDTANRVGLAIARKFDGDGVIAMGVIDDPTPRPKGAALFSTKKPLRATVYIVFDAKQVRSAFDNPQRPTITPRAAEKKTTGLAAPVVGIHFSNQQRDVLSGEAYGTGVKGAEAKRLAESKDNRIKTRIAFYVDGGAGVFPESGVGRYRHEVKLTNLYDGAKNPLKFPTSDFNQFESAVLDSGFSGYYVRAGFGRQGVAVLLGDAAKSVKVPTTIQMSKKVISGDNSRVRTPEQLKAFEDVGRSVIAPTVKERMSALWTLLKNTAQGLADQFAPIENIDHEAYRLLRQSKGASGAFAALLQGGKLKLEDGTYAFDTNKRGGVTDKLLIPLQGEADDFFWWVAANRAEQLAKEDREHLFTKESIESLKSLADGKTNFEYVIQHGANKGKITTNRSDVYKDSLITFNGFNRNVLDLSEQSGLIDPASRSLWEKEFYVPFYRVRDEGGIRGMNIGKGAVRQKAFEQLKGGKQKLNTDLLENVLLNWSHLLDAAAKNRAAIAVLNAAAKMGAVTEVETAEKDSVWAMDMGKKRFFLINDPTVLVALTAMEYAGMKGPLMDTLSLPKHLVTMGVTASPFFKIRNLIRDSEQSIAVSGLSYNVFKNLAEGVKGTKRGSDEYFNLLASGGIIHFGTMLEGNEALRERDLVKDGIDSATILNDRSKVENFYRKIVKPAMRAYNELGDRGEAINRAALYNQLRAQGVSHGEAAFQARDLMDFSMQGSFTTIRFLTRVVPFLNARIQGLYKLGKAGKANPAKLATIVMATSMFSILLMLMYKDDEDWKRREDWDRDSYWWFKFGGVAYRVPKGFELGAIASLAERGVEIRANDEFTGRMFADRLRAMLLENLSMNPIPQAVKPLLDVYANKDSFTGRPIEPPGLDILESDYRYKSYTTMTARAIGKVSSKVGKIVGVEGLSPLQVDHLIRAYFSWLGTFVVQSADIIARPLTGQPVSPSVDKIKKATGGLISQLEGAPSRYVTQMYEQAAEVEEAYATYRASLKAGFSKEAAEYYGEHAEKITKYPMYQANKRLLSKLSGEIRRIERDTKMTADQKREAILLRKKRQEVIAKRVAVAAKRK